MLTEFGNLHIVGLYKHNAKGKNVMDNIETRVSDKIYNIRNHLEGLDRRQKGLEEDLDYIEDVLESLLNYAFAENDNLEELKSDLM
jgi:hypothetical protein